MKNNKCKECKRKHINKVRELYKYDYLCLKCFNKNKPFYEFANINIS